MAYDDVISLFRKTAAQNRERIAIKQGNVEVTYENLEKTSNQVANCLLELGAQPGQTVVILVEDRIKVITGIIGSLKAGTMFVPLDPTMPQARLTEIFLEISPDFLLLESRQLTTINQLLSVSAIDATIIHLDPSSPQKENGTTLPVFSIAHHNTRLDNLVEMNPDSACYIYFTSGSTGKPKGIVGRWKAISHFIQWEIDTFDVGVGTRISQLTHPTFDAFLRDVFTPLCAGGTVCIPYDRQLLYNAPELVEWIEAEKIQIIHCVPTLFRTIINAITRSTQFSALKYVLLAGELLTAMDVKQWMSFFDDRIQLVNLYGPSETTMTKFFYFVERSDTERPIIPIGKPMPGARAIILDAQNKVCPSGIVGEIYIRTPYQTLGYWNDQHRTSAAFVPNPFTNDPQDIIYKTGDLGRILPDGNFEMLGRRDLQVKIRGVRIELGEIEDRLRQHEAITNAVVVDREDIDRNKFLVAYIVSHEPVQNDKLRQFLLETLPDYMIPSAFVSLEKLPLTPTGKVDRKALATFQKSPFSANYTAPETETEKQITEIWKSVLSIPSIGVHDSFFEMGGHSLLAIQLLSRINRTFAIDLPLAIIFDNATISQLAQQVELAKVDGMVEPLPSIIPVARQHKMPASFAQQRLWFVEQLFPGQTTYIIPLVVRITGALDVGIFQKTIDTIVQRHETLRTHFSESNGNLYQIIKPPEHRLITVIDLQGLSPDVRDAEAQRLTEKEMLRPFDLSIDRLFRTILLHLEPFKYYGLFPMHHIISDEWSQTVLVGEVTTLYNTFLSGKSTPLPELFIQYADFAEWQKTLLNTGLFEKQLAFWRRALEGAPAVLELPTDHPRATAKNRADYAYFSLSPELSQKLRLLSQEHDATLLMTLLSVFYILLGRYCNQQDILVGLPVANRNHIDTESLIGFFVNMIVLRGDLSGNPSFTDFLARVRQMATSAFSHQDLPFETLVSKLNLADRNAHSPLFQVLFVLRYEQPVSDTLYGIQLEPLEIKNQHARYDLSLDITDFGDKLTGRVEYNCDLFKRDTIARLVDHYQILLNDIVANPTKHLSELRLLSDDEQKQLRLWNKRQIDLPSDVCIHHLFERQVERNPDAVAFIYNDQTLTFDEANRRANQLAHYLQAMGIGPDSLVGLCVEHSFELAIGLLAILKAGAAYVPLDTAFPEERLKFIVEDTNLSLVLTRQHVDIQFLGDDSKIIYMDSDWPAISHYQTTNLVTNLTPHHPAYVIYTSGSTGKPKGVIIEHHSLLNVILVGQAQFGITSQDTMPCLISFLFDFFLLEFFMPLVAGGRVLLLRYHDILDMAKLTSALEKATLFHAIPSLMQQIVAYVHTKQRGNDNYKHLRMIFVGGDRVSSYLLADMNRAFSNAQIRVLYGPTEATIICTSHEIAPEQLDYKAIIGRPLPNMNIQICNQWQTSMPIGVPGELYVGGEGVGRGYLNRPELTAERFTTIQGTRFYKTGDLARYLPDGTIEFLGRIDNQVKIRGYRIELGEIEERLRTHPAVHDALVNIWERTPGDQRLIAYWISQSETTTQELKNHLSESLPTYMIPSFFVQLTHLPLTVSGKVDRDHLPLPDFNQIERERAYSEPSSTLEKVLAAIWSELLDVSEISVHDSFFQLGGHSLLATQMIARVRDYTDTQIDLLHFFESPTIADLASFIEMVHQAQQIVNGPAERIAAEMEEIEI